MQIRKTYAKQHNSGQLEALGERSVISTPKKRPPEVKSDRRVQQIGKKNHEKEK